MKPKKILLVFCLVVSLILPTKVIEAAGSSLPPGLIIGDNNGIAAEADGDYFIQVDGLVPGDSFKKEITVRNTEEKRPFFLYLKTEAHESKGSFDFLEELSVVIKVDGKILFEGTASGKGTVDMTQVPLELGRFAYGDSEVVEVTFKLNPDLTTEQFKEENSGKVKWQFSARRDELTQDKKDPGFKGLLPQTGEEWRNMLWRIAGGIFLFVLFIVLLKRNRSKENEEEQSDMNH